MENIFHFRQYFSIEKAVKIGLKGAIISFCYLALYLTFGYQLIDYGWWIVGPIGFAIGVGFCAGIFHYLMGYFRQKNPILSNIFTGIIFFILFYFVTVLGCAIIGIWD